MRKTILFPTDFTIDSLNLVKSVLSKKEGEHKYDIILLHGLHLSDSITDLLYYSKSRLIAPLTNTEFEDACVVIKNKFDSKIVSIKKDIFSGITQSAFTNYLEGNKIDEAYIPTNYFFNKKSKKSFDVIPYIKKSNAIVTQVEWSVSDEIPEKGSLAEVFFNGLASS